MQATSCIRGQAVGGRRSAAGRAAGRRSVAVQAAAANPFAEELKATAKYIATRGKGILASDESNATTGALLLLQRRQMAAKQHLLPRLQLFVQ